MYLQGVMDDARTPPDRSITRPQLELVIRRAVELYAAQTDADERLSEDEVLRIGKELGLPAAIVRQAIYEAPAPAAESIVDRWFGAAAVSVSRAVQLPEGDVASRLEEYLATREYLALCRASIRRPFRAGGRHHFQDGQGHQPAGAQLVPGAEPPGRARGPPP